MIRSAVSSLVAFAVLSGAAAHGAAPTIEWIRQLGTIGSNSRSVAVDSAGNAFIGGRTSDGLGGANAGAGDAFLTKFDSGGSELWTKQIGTSADDGGWSVAVDAAGNSYVSGYTRGSLDGANAGFEDTFLAKFDSSGNELWIKQFGTSRGDQCYSMAVDAVGNVYISGLTWGSLGGANAGLNDAFLAKFDGSGNNLWAAQIGTSSEDRSWSVAVDAAGNAYISGFTYGSLGGANAGYADAFLTKFDSSGTELWTEQIGTSATDVSKSVAVDAAGNVYISGFTNGSLGGTNTPGHVDAFLTKFDSSGSVLWTEQIGTRYADESNSVAVDAAGNAYISGFTNGSLGGTHAGQTDAFLTKFDSSGSELWTEQIGTGRWDESYSVAVDQAGNAYISGVTFGILGRGEAVYPNAFLVKYRVVPEPGAAALAVLAGILLFHREGRERA